MADQENRVNKEDMGDEGTPTASYSGAAMGPGAQIGQFRIEREIGRGAMGIVYLAHDAKLNRQVAIKSLATEILASPKARSRFSREARMLASLNHPNIATIHDELGEAEGIGYLILEYVPGQTLAERIAKGGFKLQESLSIALQIAEAVSAAHDHDVIHRDLKPGNIKITPDGKVKVLDFGLAKVVGGDAVDQQTTITEPGRVMGTPAYMSPEQARGQATDKRSDIWAFGCILYEMLTATIPFRGETISDTLANILQTEPDWAKLPEKTPDNVKTLLGRCMEKNPQRRLRDIGDAALEIHDTINLPQMVSPLVHSSQDTPSSRRTPNWNMITSWGIIVLLILVLFWQSFMSKTISVNAPSYCEIIPDTNAPFEPVGNAPHTWGQPALAISPDGKTLVYVAKDIDANDTILYKRVIGSSFASEPIQDTKAAFCPFFSPDGNWVGFFTLTKLKKVPINNGPVVSIADVQNPRGGDWSVDGKIWVGNKQGTKLAYVAEDGEDLTELAIQGSQKFRTNCSEILPDGKTALLIDPYKGINAVNLRTGMVHNVHTSGTHAKYLKNGFLLFVKDGVLHTAKFDINKRKIVGNELPVNNIKVRVETSLGCAQLDVSNDGTLVFAPGNSLLQSQFVWTDRTGNEQNLGIEAKAFGHFDLSPDGTKLAVQVGRRNAKIWVYTNLDDAHPVGTLIGDGTYPSWSSDGNSVVYTHENDGTYRILTQSFSGTDSPSELMADTEFIVPAAYLPEQGLLVFMNNVKLYLKDLNSHRRSELFKRDYQYSSTSLSRDMKYMAYLSDETGQFDCYVTEFPEPNHVVRVSTSGGDPIVFSKNTDELFYRNDAKFYQVSYTTEPGFDVNEITELFEGDYLNVSGIEMDVSADGDKFLLLKSVDEDFDPHRLNIITNWFEEFK